MLKKLAFVTAITLMFTTAAMYCLLPVQATVNEDTSANRYTANGSTTIFTYTFRILSKTNLEVLVDSTTKIVDVDYLVSGVGSATGGNVTFLAAPAANATVTILRNQPAAQSNTYYPNEPFPSTRVEKDFDRLVMHVQQLKERLDRALTFTKSSTLTGQTVDAPTAGLFARAKTGGGIDWATPTNAGALSSPVGISDGGTGATTAAGARANLLSYSENTLVDAKGDLLIGQFDNSLARLAPPTTVGMVPQFDNAGTVGISWGYQQQLNPIINGMMEVWQRGTTFVSPNSQLYQADRFSWNFSNSGAVTINRSTNVPTVAQAGVLFNYSYEVDVTTADTALAAGEHAGIWHFIEGYNWRQFAQRDLILSFWVMSSKVGTHSVGLSNTAPDRGYVATYTINTADTWERKTVTITASPSAGTWNYTNGRGILVAFSLGCGSTYQIAAGAWTTISSAALCTSATVNDIDNAANFFRITGIKLELGSVATPIQFVPFEQELIRCKRYFQKSFLYATAPAQNAGTAGEYLFTAVVAGAASNASASIPFSPNLRNGVTPTLTLFNGSAANAQIRNETDSADLTSSVGSNGSDSSFRVSGTGTAGTAVGEILGVQWTAEAEL